MEKLFGIPMDTVMVVLLVMFAMVTGLIAVIALRNRVMLKLGLRNIPRRRSQTILIVVGLTLATIIITSAFGTGDTMTYSIRTLAVDQLGNIDEVIRVSQSAAGASDIGSVQYFPMSEYDRLREALQGYDKIDGMAPFVAESAPLIDVTSQQNKSRVSVFGVPADDATFAPLGQDGQKVDLKALGPNEVYITEDAAKSLDAKAGDQLQLFASQTPRTFTLKGVIRKDGLPDVTAALVMPLDRTQSLFGKEGQINRIIISNRGGVYEGAKSSAEVTKKLRSLLADGTVVGEIASILASPSVKPALEASRDKLIDKQKDKLSALITEVQKGTVTDELKSLLGDDVIAAQLKNIAKDLPDQDAADRLGALLSSISRLAVDDVKARNIDQADQLGSAFTSVFVGFGLFSIGAGILLIFLIFVMLAAERKPEMGMARAVGTKRRHLIQMFVFEGFAYDLIAAAVGVAAGVAVGFVMVGVIAAALGQSAGEQGLEIRRHFEVRSLIVSYCLGMLLTFITASVSAWRVSKLNIVAAIRDLPDIQRARSSLMADFLRPFKVLVSAFQNLFHLRIRRAMGDFLRRGPRATWSFWWTLFKAGPLTLLVSVPMVAIGIEIRQAFPFSLGVGIAILGLGLTVRWALSLFKLRTEVRDRVGFTIAGVLLVVWWSLPFDTPAIFGVPELQSGIEMFFLSGVMMVLGAVLAVIYNSGVFIALLTTTVGRIGRLTPVVKTAVAYPMSFKFRTGLTIAMFALVIFTMMVMSIVINTMTAMFADRDVMSGGYPIQGTVSYNNPVKDIRAAISDSGKLNPADFEAVGGQSTLGVQVRQVNGGSPAWEGYVLQAVDDGFLDSNGFRLSTKAKGYETDRDVWRAVKENSGLAVVDTLVVPQKNGTSVIIGGPTFRLSGVFAEDTTMDPIEVEVRDPFAGKVIKLAIIGVLDNRSFARGIYTSQGGITKALPYELPTTTYYFRLKPGADTANTARALGSAFLQNGMEARVVNDDIDKSLSSSLALNNLLQGFMGLGLLVGIAALGVISTRAVVERRQQIGVLRALGYKRGMVQLSFLLESSFVALIGIVLGVGLGLILSYNLVTSMAKTQQGIEFTPPWLQILLIVIIGYGASLLTTFLPARQAARIYPAEALRYE